MLFVHQFVTMFHKSLFAEFKKDKLQLNNILPGHSSTWQLSSRRDTPSHSLPPCLADTFSVLLLILVPPPHDLEQSSITHSFHLQWTIGL
jgi:hypothetical protein